MFRYRFIAVTILSCLRKDIKSLFDLLFFVFDCVIGYRTEIPNLCISDRAIDTFDISDLLETTESSRVLVLTDAIAFCEILHNWPEFDFLESRRTSASMTKSQKNCPIAFRRHGKMSLHLMALKFASNYLSISIFVKDLFSAIIYLTPTDIIKNKAFHHSASSRQTSKSLSNLSMRFLGIAKSQLNKDFG